jgi:cold shock CspA family protein/ribosome-associated translation inhibitor RaiA
MEIPLKLSFHGVHHSPAIEDRVRKKAAVLDRFRPHVMSCRVAIEEPHRHHHKGKLFHVRIDLTVAGREIVIGRDHQDRHEHEDPYVAIRDAFAAAVRKLEDHIRRLRRVIKTHGVPDHGMISSISSYQGFGFIRTPDGQEVYFHENSLIDALIGRLEVGDEVRFVLHEPVDEQGSHASSVRLIGKHHPQSPPRIKPA